VGNLLQVSPSFFASPEIRQDYFHGVQNNEAFLHRKFVEFCSIFEKANKSEICTSGTFWAPGHAFSRKLNKFNKFSALKKAGVL